MHISDLLAKEKPHDATSQMPSGQLRCGAAVSEKFLKLKLNTGEGANDAASNDLVRPDGRQSPKKKTKPKTRG